MDASSTGALVATQVGAIGTEGLVILGAVAAIIGGLILWKFAVKKAKGSVK